MLKQVVCVVTSVVYRDIYTQQKKQKVITIFGVIH
jgi:hypothetical protein